MFTKIQYQNAKTCIKQIKGGEFICRYDEDAQRIYTATNYRTEARIWLANGPIHLDQANNLLSRKSSAFGIFRLWVWYAAARKLKRDEEKLMKPSRDYVLPE